ncbi:MAG TPA: hypothetical protein PLG66_13665 [Calditrichia bacterium]|nr:hypothetical protein [Calditrichia bacterium]
MKKLISAYILGICLLALPLQAQSSLESLLERFTGPNGKGYFQPLVTAFGANLNSGWFYTAKVPVSGLHILFRANGNAAFFSEEQRYFEATTEGLFIPPQKVKTPTIIGPGEGTAVTGEGGAVYQFVGGYDMKSLAAVSPTITIGSLWGTELSIRYFTLRINDDIGRLKLAGAGIRHTLNAYFPEMPVDLTFGMAFQRFELGDVFATRLYFYHAEVGKSASVFDFYGGMGIEASSADLTYTFEINDESSDVDLSMEGENKFRVFAGLAINLAILHLNVDYNIGKQQLLNVGVTLGL